MADSEVGKKVQGDPSREVAALFREGTTALLALADACNNIDARRVSVALEQLQTQLSDLSQKALKAAGEGGDTIGGRTVIARLPRGIDVVK